MSKEQLLNELKAALPSRRLLDVARTIAVQNPYNQEVYVLKQRVETPIENLQLFAEKRHAEHDYQDVHGQNILIHPSLLHPRARIAFEKLANIS